MDNYSSNIPAYNSQQPVQNVAKPRRNVKGVLMKALPIVLVLALAGVAGFLGYKYYDLKKGYDPQTAEFKTVTAEVKELINISEDEEVRVAKITDLEELRKQNEAFYKNAKIGQYLIVLPETQRLLIYDKELGKIVNFSSYNITVDLIDEAKIADTEKPLTIEIRAEQGTDEAVVTQIEERLAKLSTNYKITVATESTSNDYEGLSLVLLNRTEKPNMSQNIMAHTGTTSVAEILPDNEKSTTADVILFVGSDVKLQETEQ